MRTSMRESGQNFPAVNNQPCADLDEVGWYAQPHDAIAAARAAREQAGRRWQGAVDYPQAVHAPTPPAVPTISASRAHPGAAQGDWSDYAEPVRGTPHDGAPHGSGYRGASHTAECSSRRRSRPGWLRASILLLALVIGMFAGVTDIGGHPVLNAMVLLLFAAVLGVALLAASRPIGFRHVFAAGAACVFAGLVGLAATVRHGVPALLMCMVAVASGYLIVRMLAWLWQELGSADR